MRMIIALEVDIAPIVEGDFDDLKIKIKMRVEGSPAPTSRPGRHQHQRRRAYVRSGERQGIGRAHQSAMELALLARAAGLIHLLRGGREFTSAPLPHSGRFVYGRGEFTALLEPGQKRKTNGCSRWDHPRFCIAGIWRRSHPKSARRSPCWTMEPGEDVAPIIIPVRSSRCRATGGPTSWLDPRAPAE